MSQRTQQVLRGRTAIVTGASSGIGRAIAEQLGAAGAHVFLVGRRVEPMEATRSQIIGDGGDATVVQADVRSPAAVRGIVDRAVAETGTLNIMVNNAGVYDPASICEGDPENWLAMLETNILAVLVGCQAAVRAMRAIKAEGHIVNIASNAAQRRDSGVYGSTKHAVDSISGSLRNELEGDTIRVTNILPGIYATNLSRDWDPAFVQGLLDRAGIDHRVVRGEYLPEDVLTHLKGPMRQIMGDPADVARAVLYAVTQPIDVNVLDICIRPPKRIDLPG
jgi:NADP-dependent 3-hydroxy acid dehydrogenase YdfG